MDTGHFEQDWTFLQQQLKKKKKKKIDLHFYKCLQVIFCHIHQVLYCVCVSLQKSKTDTVYENVPKKR